jgi:hypothetical protein
MQKFTWLDNEDETLLEAELASLEEDQDFLSHYYGVSMLLNAVSEADGYAEGEFESDFDFDTDALAS